MAVPGRLAPCHRTRMLQDIPLTVGRSHLPTGTLIQGTATASQRRSDRSQCSEPGVSAHPRRLFCLHGPLPLLSTHRRNLLQNPAFSQAIPIKCCYFLLCPRAPIRCSEAGLGPEHRCWQLQHPSHGSSLCLRGVCTSLTNCNGLNSFTGRCSLQFFLLLTVPSLESHHE